MKTELQEADPVDEVPQGSRLRGTLRAQYDQWRELTEAEGRAIATGDWHQVSELQRTKRQLRSQITDTTRELRQENDRLGLPAVNVGAEFHPVIRMLLDLEKANAQVLAARKTEALQKKNRLDRALQNIRQVHRAYIHEDGSLWETYS